MYHRLYKHRFEIFLTTQLFILFGSLLVPAEFFEDTILPLLFLLNITTGLLLVSKKKKLLWFLMLLFVVSVVAFGSQMFSRSGSGHVLVRLSVYFIFYIVVTLQVIKQVWHAKFVSKNVVMGLMSGYIALGFLAFFLFLSIELITPGSFSGSMLNEKSYELMTENLMYYAYITLMTIGYGEIVPATPVAQKAAILTGLVGQFYLVIITAVVVEKYIRHSAKGK